MIYGSDVSNNLQECKLASGRVASNGYYRKNYKSKNYLAHRLAYILAYGEPPRGYEIHHLCHKERNIKYKNKQEVRDKINAQRRDNRAKLKVERLTKL